LTMWLWVCSGDGGELSCRSEIMESKRKEKKSLVKHVASLRHLIIAKKKKLMCALLHPKLSGSRSYVGLVRGSRKLGHRIRSRILGFYFLLKINK